jgi:CRP-like cAMP-binding protein
MAISPSSVAIRNRLLTALPPNVLSRLLPQLHPVSLSVRDTPFPPETAIEAVHFVETGWVSLVSALDDGAQAEVGLIGREGMVGLPLIIGVETAFEEAFVQADGTACVWKRPHFGGQCELQRLIFRYHGAMNAQTMQTAACNGRHDLEQRLARGLLMAHDRADGDTLQITQEFLAIMLCVYRPTITVAATIRYARGHLTCWIGPRWKQPRAIATPLCSAGLPACLARELSTRL